MLPINLAALAASAQPNVDLLTRLTELLALHGVYALVVFFLFYQQRRTLRDFTSAEPANRLYLQRIHKSAVITTYVLIAIAIPVWVFATFVYKPRTVLWGDVANLTRMAGAPQQPGQIYLDQQITPEERDVRFYVDPRPDATDPTKTTLFWALVADGQYSQVPLIFFQRVQELLPPDADMPSDPNRPSQPRLRENIQRRRFVIQMKTCSVVPGSAFDYQYDPDGTDPYHRFGKMRLLCQGNNQPVPLEEVTAQTRPLPAEGVVAFFHSWLRPASVLAQHSVVANASQWLPLLGSTDLKQQLAAEQVITTSGEISWPRVRNILTDPKATPDHALFVHNLSGVIAKLPANGADVPADIRLDLAKGSYQVSDFKTATTFFNTLNDKDLSGDVTNYYYRGVANLQTGQYTTAQKDLTTYINKAPSPSAKAVARRTLSLADHRATLSK